MINPNSILTSSFYGNTLLLERKRLRCYSRDTTAQYSIVIREREEQQRVFHCKRIIRF